MGPRVTFLASWTAGMACLAAAEPRVYLVDPGTSQVTVHVGKAGLFKFAGHEHKVVAPIHAGRVEVDVADLARSSVTLSFDSAELRLMGKDEPSEDVPKVQDTMRSSKVLDVARFPAILFSSRSVAGRAISAGVYEISVTGELTLHGVTKELRLPLRTELAGDVLTVTGKTVLRHADFEMTPVSVAGVVKVKDELGLEYRIVARPEAAPAD